MWTSWPAIPDDRLCQVTLPPFLPTVRPHLEIWKSGQWPVPLSPWVFSRPPAVGKTRKNELGCCRHTELLSPVVCGRCHWVWWFINNLTVCHAQEICDEKTRRTSQSVWCHHGPSLARPGIMLSQLFLCSCKDVPQPPRSQFETSAEAKTAAKRKKQMQFHHWITNKNDHFKFKYKIIKWWSFATDSIPLMQCTHCSLPYNPAPRTCVAATAPPWGLESLLFVNWKIWVSKGKKYSSCMYIIQQYIYINIYVYRERERL